MTAQDLLQMDETFMERKLRHVRELGFDAQRSGMEQKAKDRPWRADLPSMTGRRANFDDGPRDGRGAGGEVMMQFDVNEVIHWVRSIGPGPVRDVVHCYFKGMCDRSDEGRRGFDVKMRPYSLGCGPYTCTVGRDAVEMCPGTDCTALEKKP